MKFVQKKATTTTLDSAIIIGELVGYETNAKSGNYHVYDVKRESGIDDTALLFVHEDKIQDVNELLPTLDVEVVCDVDGGTYGIITKPQGIELTSDDWFKRLSDYDKTTCENGYVSYTNYGDGKFKVYTNKDHSVFLLDDVDIYLQSLLSDQGIDYDDFEALEYYACHGDEIQVSYYTQLEPGQYKMQTVKRIAGDNTRKIQTLANLLVELSPLLIGQC